MRDILRMTAAAAVLGMAGCGGSGGSATVNGTTTPVPTPPASALPSFAATTFDADIAGYSVDTGAVQALSGRLQALGSAYTFAGLTGTLNADKTEAILSDGRKVTLTPTGKYSFRYAVEGGGSGVGGLAAQTIPTTGTAEYTGETAMLITTGTAQYHLTGTSTAQADFAKGMVDVVLGNTTGTRTSGITTLPISNVATITLSDAAISGTGFSGGTVRMASTVAGVFLTGGETIEHQGGFFAEGAELGGAMVIDDSVTGTTTVHATYTGK